MNPIRRKFKKPKHIPHQLAEKMVAKAASHASCPAGMCLVCAADNESRDLSLLREPGPTRESLRTQTIIIPRLHGPTIPEKRIG